jgi:iron complex outermembrane receptor protein
MVHTVSLRRALGRACSSRALVLALAVSAATPALAQTAATAPVNLDLGAVLSTSTGSTADLASTPGTAPYNAPSYAPLNSGQPTSVVKKNVINNQLIGTQSYADAAALTPSVAVISPNGPGLQEASGPTIRGFQDGQYNVTFDGIPIGDSNDFTHHTTSFFTSSEIDQVIVDRGPGTSETIGDATFGGTMSIRTINPSATTTLTPYSTYGSYNTSDVGMRLDTGAVQSADGSSAVFNVEHLQSNGALTNANQERSNFFGKVMIPVGTNTVVTFLADYNKLYQNPAYGATLSQMSALGDNYAYNGDPNSQAYYKYNNDEITTDMEYVDVQSNFGNGFLYDGKIYTYAYYHHDLNGDDVNDTEANGVTQAGAGNQVVLTPGGTAQAGVPGQTFLNDYRSVGTIQRLQKDLSFGDIKAGIWFDHQVNSRLVQDVSLTNGNAINYDTNDSNGGTGTSNNGATQDAGYENDYGSIERLQHNQLYTFQPYAQLDYKPIYGLTLTPGVKYAFFRRQLDEQVQQGTELPTGYEHNYDKLLPSFEAKYLINPNTSVYGQVAEGFLAPNLNVTYTTNVNNQSVQPETTWNYQTGAAYQDQHWALGGDVYYIHFLNYIQKVGGGTDPTYENFGGVIYRGVEGEATYTFDVGLSLFANAGYNQAFQTSTNIHVTGAPQGTANFGLIYDKNGIYASIIDQWTGGEYSGNTGTNVATGAAEGSAASGTSPGGWYDPYNVVNLAVGYTFNHLNPHLDQIKLKVNALNITNQKQIIYDDGTNGSGDLLYYRLLGTSVFATITVPINF